jgi:hypothetical protein
MDSIIHAKAEENNPKPLPICALRVDSRAGIDAAEFFGRLGVSGHTLTTKQATYQVFLDGGTLARPLSQFSYLSLYCEEFLPPKLLKKARRLLRDGRTVSTLEERHVDEAIYQFHLIRYEAINVKTVRSGVVKADRLEELLRELLRRDAFAYRLLGGRDEVLEMREIIRKKEEAEEAWARTEEYDPFADCTGETAWKPAEPAASACDGCPVKAPQESIHRLYRCPNMRNVILALKKNKLEIRVKRLRCNKLACDACFGYRKHLDRERIAKKFREEYEAGGAIWKQRISAGRLEAVDARSKRQSRKTRHKGERYAVYQLGAVMEYFTNAPLVGFEKQSDLDAALEALDTALEHAIAVPGKPPSKAKKTDRVRLRFATASRGWAAAREKKDPVFDNLGYTPNPPRVVKATCEKYGYGYNRVYPARGDGLVTLDERISVPPEGINLYEKFLDELKTKAASEITEEEAGRDATISDVAHGFGVSRRWMTPEEEIDQGYADWLDTA